MSDAALLRRTGDLKGGLVAFFQQPRYDRAASSFLAEYGNGLEDADEQRWMLLWDCFVLEHRLANGRTMVEQFVEARPDLPEVEREMVLGWRDVVQGPFEVQRAGTDPARQRAGHRLSARAGHVFAYSRSGVPKPGQDGPGMGTPAC